MQNYVTVNLTQESKMSSEAQNKAQKSHVYTAITAITAALSKEGITKSRKNAQQGYTFRGIDDIYNALASELAKNELCVLPRVLERTCEERMTKSGGTLFYVTVKVAFDCVSAQDGSAHEIVTFGEAMDSGDKATNKAMSAAYKYAALMAFCIPTEGDNDTENATHEVAPKTQKVQVANEDKDLMARAKIFASQIDNTRSELELTDVVAKGTKLQSELKAALPEWSDRLMVKISERQNSFRLIGAA
jgi:ERF superfamily